MNKEKEIRDKLALLKRIQKNCVEEKRLPNPKEAETAGRLLDEVEELKPGATEDSWFRESQIPPDKPNPQGGIGNTRDDHDFQPSARALSGKQVTYRNLFGNPRQDSDFESFGEYLQVVASNRYDDRLQTRTQNITTPSDGGFAVPEQYAGQIIDMVLEKSLLMDKVTVYPMTSASLKVPAISDTDHSADRGGIASTWKAELATLDLDSIELRQLEFSAKKLTVMIRASREFLEDALAAETFVRNTMAAELAWQLDHVMLNTGSAGTPLSILNSPGTITAAAEGGQAAGTLLWNNLANMAKSFNPAASDSGIWVISPSLRDQAYEMSIAVGTGGSSVYPAPSQVRERGLSLMGYPVYWSEHCSAAGNVGDCFLISPKSYAVSMRSDIKIESSMHVGFTSDSTYFRGTIRVDGMPINNSTLTLADGSTEVSDFVTLAART